MKRYTHLLSGVAAGSVIASLSGCDPVPLLIIGALFGIFPDFDILFTAIDRRIHRSAASHSLLASAIFATVWFILLTAVDGQYLDWLDAVPLIPSTVVVFMASFVHTLEDTLTFHGCRLLFPLSRRTYKGVVRFDDLAVNAGLSVIALVITFVFLGSDVSSSLPLLLSLGKL